MICSVCAIGLHYVILKFLSVNLFLWGHFENGGADKWLKVEGGGG